MASALSKLTNNQGQPSLQRNLRQTRHDSGDERMAIGFSRREFIRCACSGAAGMARSQEGDLVENAVGENVRRTVTRLRTSPEPILLEPLQEGKLRIVGARYDLGDGKVDWFMES